MIEKDDEEEDDTYSMVNHLYWYKPVRPIFYKAAQAILYFKAPLLRA